MSYAVALSLTETEADWRNAARLLASNAVPADEVSWHLGEAPRGLFAPIPLPAMGSIPLAVPRAFADFAQTVLCHNDATMAGDLYRLLIRLQHAPRLLSDSGDALVRRLQNATKAISRDTHKMKAFVRFREIPADGPRRRFAAWFEPDHRIEARVAPFFARRFTDMDWAIYTPNRAILFVDGVLDYGPGGTRPPLHEDATEALWGTYFANIFNPARIKISAMRSEMPLKYWKNMPETALIPQMLADAPARVAAMQAAGATAPRPGAERITKRYRAAQSGPSGCDTLNDARAMASTCTRCGLCEAATQTVFGEGNPEARIMLVGEQAGDAEDLAGRPFVGPAGTVLDRALAAAGIDRQSLWITNAVKHFKFTPRGKRRIHQRPDVAEIEACRWWLDVEHRLIRPQLTLALGATAARALTGCEKDIAKRRLASEVTAFGKVTLTWHPAAILRDPDKQRADLRFTELVADLNRAVLGV